MTDPVTAVPAEEPIPRGYWRKANGTLIHESKIKPIDKERHKLVCELVEQAKEMNALLASFRAEMDRKIDEFLEHSAAAYGVTMRGSKGKGNITLSSFDGVYKLERQQQDRIAFDERLQIAKEQMDECASRFMKGGNLNAKALLEVAFHTDKAGKVSVARILDLCRAKIDDPQWLTAVQIVRDSMQTVGSAQYTRAYQINSKGGYDAVSPNRAAL